jgi:DNA-binding NarL/FixJ family response regulator
MIRLLIADDHPIVLDGLKQLFAVIDDMEVVGVAMNGTEVLDAVRRGGFDLLMLDMTMPGPSGAELIARIRIEEPKLPILVLSIHNEPLIVRHALRAGASGYVTKDNDLDHLLAAIYRVAAGGRYIDPVVAELFAAEIAGESAALLAEQLSERDIAVMRLSEKGLNVGEIAAALSISSGDVTMHKARLQRFPR